MAFLMYGKASVIRVPSAVVQVTHVLISSGENQDEEIMGTKGLKPAPQ